MTELIPLRALSHWEVSLLDMSSRSFSTCPPQSSDISVLKQTIDFTMKTFYILCACAVVSAAPNPGVSKQHPEQEENLHEYPKEVRALLAKQGGAHPVDKRLFFGAIFNAVDSVFKGAQNVVEGAGRAAGSAVGHVVGSTLDVVGHAANGVVGGVGSAAKGVGQAATAVVKGAESAVKNLGKAAEAIVGGVGGVIENVGQAVTSGNLREALQNLGEAAGSAVGGVANGAKHVGAAVEDVAQGVASGTQSLTKAAKDLVDGVTSVCHVLAQGPRIALQRVENKVMDAVQSVPVVGEAAAMALTEKYMEALKASGAVGQISEAKCRAAILAFVAG